MGVDELQRLDRRWQALRLERSSWWEHWMEISRYLLPRNGRYFVCDRDKGYKRNHAIYDNTGSKALRVLAAGMMSGMTSPSRPWFRLLVADRALLRRQPVRQWLGEVTEIMEDVLARSNAYRVLHGMYEELGAFGTAAALIAEDYRYTVHLFPFTIGEYAIATDWQGRVVTLYREFEKTVGEVVAAFGLASCSPHVRSAFQRGDLDGWITLRHSIEPRTDRQPGRLDAGNMPWQSCYWEAGRGDGRLLRKSGFRSFPCLAPRWTTQGGDIYGNSPGMEALGDIKQLQQQQLRKSQAIDYQTHPPLQAPTTMKNREMQIFPGGISYYDAALPTPGIRSAFEVQLDLRALLEDVQDVRGRINGAFYSDLFLMISQQPANGAMTATEVAQRYEEKMLVLGQVVERLNNELLDPLVTTVFERLLSAGLLPAPPSALHGQELHIEYTSMLAQAQKSVTVSGIDRFVHGMGQIALLKPDVLDKFDADRWADVYSDKLGVEPELIVSGRQLALLRGQRQAQAQLAARQAAMQQGSEVLKNMGQTPTQPGTAAGDALAGVRAAVNAGGEG
ncbi:MAG: portal protein [Methylococcales bacterium]|nr:portal protein [Methylococcales bacterium]